MELFGETIERELPNLMRQRCPRALRRPPDRAPASVRETMDAVEARTASERPTPALDRLRLRRSRRARRCRAAASSRKGSTPRTSTRTRSRRASTRPRCRSPTSSSARPGELRISNFLLWQARLLGARLRRHALARLRRAATCGARSRSTRLAAAASAVDELDAVARRSSSSRCGLPVVARRRLARRLVDVRARRSSPRLIALARALPRRPASSGRSCLAGFGGTDRRAARRPARRDRLDGRRDAADAAARVRLRRSSPRRGSAATVSLAFTVARRGLDRARARAPDPAPRDPRRTAGSRSSRC